MQHLMFSYNAAAATFFCSISLNPLATLRLNEITGKKRDQIKILLQKGCQKNTVIMAR